MLDAARAQFVEHGYTATTMDQIAADAGVAVQTVYYTFRTKGRLLIELVDVTAAGSDEPVRPMERPWAVEMLATASASRALALAVEHGTAIYDRVAGLWPTVNAAAAVDPDVARYWAEVGTRRRNGQAALIAHLRALEAMPTDLDEAKAVDILFLMAGHDTYRNLVIDAGWSPESYRAWLFATLKKLLLASQRRDPKATAGLSFAS